MRRKLTWLLLFSTAITVTALYRAKKAGATPSSGFSSSTLALGRFGDIDVVNSLAVGKEGKIWLSEQRSQGLSDLYVVSNTWQPGGSTGWHKHHSHSLIIVTAGTLTDYEGNDPKCTPHVYTQGMGFIDHGGEDHVHIIRNEGDVVASSVVVQLIPAGATRRLDVDAPGNCSF